MRYLEKSKGLKKPSLLYKAEIMDHIINNPTILKPGASLSLPFVVAIISTGKLNNAKSIVNCENPRDKSKP